MCGRYELKGFPDELAELLELGPDNVLPAEVRLDVRPTEQVPLVLCSALGKLQFASWGIGAARTINVRGDKLGTIWKGAAEERRALIPATAFYEWREVPGQKKKQRVRFARRDGKAFCFAGLWARSGDQLTCAIVTTEPSSLVAGVHDRMPAILQREAVAIWGAPGRVEVEALRGVVGAYPEALMIAEDCEAGATVETPRQRELF